METKEQMLARMARMRETRKLKKLTNDAKQTLETLKNESKTIADDVLGSVNKIPNPYAEDGVYYRMVRITNSGGLYKMQTISVHSGKAILIAESNGDVFGVGMGNLIRNIEAVQ